MSKEKEEIKKLLKSRTLSSLNDFNSIMKEIAKDVLEIITEEEMTDFLGYGKYDYQNKSVDNSRNGYSKKRVNTSFGELEYKNPRDRNSEYESKIVNKYQKDITGIENKIISMYSKGMTTRDIQEHLLDIYNYDISAESVSNITNKILDKAKECQNRPLQEIYTIVFMDATFVKIRKDSKIKNCAVYCLIGITLEGTKECLGLWIMESESAKFWLNILNEIKNRGVKDILIFSVDGLTGLVDAIQSSFPESEVQRCVVHQIRNSLKYVSWKDRKLLAKDLKHVYTSPTEDLALELLEKFNEKWSNKYPTIYKSWKLNWNELSTFFKYPKEIRRVIYTTNSIESFNRQLKKYIKSHTLFPNDESVFKVIYLSIESISKKWTQKIPNWGLIFSQLSIYFEEVLSKYLL